MKFNTMEKRLTDDTFLARWISGDLSAEELDAFKKSKDYPGFKKINDGSLKLQAPAYNKEVVLSKLKQKLEAEKQGTKVLRLIPNWVYSAAAILVVALGVFFFMGQDSQFQTGFGEQLAVTLPDNSKVQLNANSQLGFRKKTWDEKREVELKGEAFFDVEKGASFKVLTANGTVEVLGTEFNVIVRGSYFEVQCHEGRVQVKSNNEEAVLTPGKAFRIENNKVEKWAFSQDKPTWLQGETTFKNAPLTQVIKALENQFNIKVDASKMDKNLKFTGGFSHESLKLALKTVFNSLGISYTIKDEKHIILVNKNK